MSINLKNIGSYIFVFSLLDLLIFPRVLFSLLLPVSLIFTICNLPFRMKKKELFVLVLFFLIMLTSILCGLILGYKTDTLKNVQRAIQLSSVLLYAQLFIDFELVQIPIRKVLRLYFLWLFILISLFFFFKDTYVSLISTLYPETLEYLDWNMQTLRMGYAFSDPNSFAYLTCMAIFLMAITEKNKTILNLVWLIAILAVLLSQSRGGLICIVILFFYFVIAVQKLSNTIVLISILFIATLSILVMYQEQIEVFSELAFSRLESEESVGGGRADKYKYFFKNFNFLPFGVGYELVKDGVEFRPHSDLIRLGLSYGIFSFPLFYYFIRPRVKEQKLLLLIVIIPFLINSLIDDYRLVGLAILIFNLLNEKSYSKREAEISAN